MTRAVLNSVFSSPSSFDRPKTLALEMLTRSFAACQYYTCSRRLPHNGIKDAHRNSPRKASRYMIHRKGTTWRSILAMRRRSVVCGGHWTSATGAATVAPAASSDWTSPDDFSLGKADMMASKQTDDRKTCLGHERRERGLEGLRGGRGCRRENPGN